MKIAAISYNSILSGRKNGWIDEGLFLIQNDPGQVFLAQQHVTGTIPERAKVRTQGISKVEGAVMSHWETLIEVLPQFDKVLIYVGDSGSKHTIRYASEHGLDAAKAIFILCDCNENKKRQLIRQYGFGESEVIMCECGGQLTMLKACS